MRFLASGALFVTLLILPAAAQVPPPAEKPGVVEPAPILMPSATMALRNDLAVLQAAIEGYRAAHFYRYPEASSLEALVELLVHTDDLPEGYRLEGTVTEFVANRRGYRISARTNGDALTIRPPERFDPFWAMLLHPL